MRLRLVIIALLLLTAGLAHWLTPIEQLFSHAVHVAMRKTFILPVVLGAVWFNLSGALVTAGARLNIEARRESLSDLWSHQTNSPIIRWPGFYSIDRGSLCDGFAKRQSSSLRRAARCLGGAGFQRKSSCWKRR